MNPFEQTWALQLLIIEDEKLVRDLQSKAELMIDSELYNKTRDDLRSELNAAEDRLHQNRKHLSMLTRESS